MIEAADALRPAIPGLTTRPYRAGDGAVVSGLYTAMDSADGVPWRSTAEEMENWMSRPTPSFDARRDATLVEVDGKPIAVRQVEWVDTNDGLREYRVGGGVHPDWRRRGIGRWLLRDAEAHARDRDAADPTDRPRFYGCWVPDVRSAAIEFIGREGYVPVRYFFEMARPSLDDIPEPSLPDGLVLRPVLPDRMKQLWDADIEAFVDHWGGFDSSDAAFQSWLGDPKFDPSLHVIAWDGDEIAGGVINEISEAENEAFNRKRGWLASVFVRRPWRRRGLARALTLRSMEVLRERGMTSAGLGVDADNPNAALRLYEGTGFEVEFRSAAYRKPLS
jgi:mycothiol synthase